LLSHRVTQCHVPKPSMMQSLATHQSNSPIIFALTANVNRNSELLRPHASRPGIYSNAMPGVRRKFCFRKKSSVFSCFAG
jgi:hypothetical protein